MNKEELSLLAEEKGFEYSDVDIDIDSEDWYLELCLIQRWLMKNHKIHLEFYYNFITKKYCLVILKPGYVKDYGFIYDSSDSALESGVYNSLLLIE